MDAGSVEGSMMNTVTLDKKILELAKIEKQIDALSLAKERLRKEVFSIAENISEPYKNGVATVSYADYKNIRIKDEDVLLKYLKTKKEVKYYEIVPEHLELTPAFNEDVKNGLFKHPLISVTETKKLNIRFKEDNK